MKRVGGWIWKKNELTLKFTGFNWILESVINSLSWIYYEYVDFFTQEKINITNYHQGVNADSNSYYRKLNETFNKSIFGQRSYFENYPVTEEYSLFFCSNFMRYYPRWSYAQFHILYQLWKNSHFLYNNQAFIDLDAVIGCICAFSNNYKIEAKRIKILFNEYTSLEYPRQIKIDDFFELIYLYGSDDENLTDLAYVVKQITDELKYLNSTNTTIGHDIEKGML